MSQIKAIIFDFYGVISLREHEVFLQSTVKDYEGHLDEIHSLSRQHDLGIISVEDYINALAKLSGLSREEVVSHMHSERAINDPLLTFIKSDLKNKYKIGMLSNAASDLLTFVEPKILNEIFDEVVISAEIGVIKPEKEAYLITCDKLNVASDEAIMIDDLAINCQGAEEAGMKAIHYKNNQQCIREINEVL